jgi:CTP:molybdopterin cytidylyltransferase MocA
MSRPNLRIVILAAQRPGVIDPLASRFGVSHKCLIPFADKPLIAHVLQTVLAYEDAASVTVSTEENSFVAIKEAIAAHGIEADAINWTAAADNLADSVIAAAQGHDGPMIVTTADNPLLMPESLDAMMRALRRFEVAIAMSPREAVHAAHAEGQRRFYRFRDGEFSNCNLYGIAGPAGLKATEAFRGGGQFAKKASRIVEAFGLINLILLQLRLISLGSGLSRISRRLGVRIAPVLLTDGSQAIDVDNDRTYGVASEIMARRALPSVASKRVRQVA